MASPEVERPLTSPSHAAISPRRRPPVSTLNKKVVTFGERCQDSNVPTVQPTAKRAKTGSQKNRKTGSSGEEKDENEIQQSKRTSFPPPAAAHNKRNPKTGTETGRPIRKRSYSFSEGHCKSVSVPTSKRWKSNYHINKAKDDSAKVNETAVAGKGGKKSKFLLGGNSRDPLNLGSLSDERISKMVNAVTPESSPLPTPKHRKPGYKIEVLIPPNISDPLNLMNPDAEQSVYESQLLSPSFARRKKIPAEDGVMKKPRHRKRVRSAKHKGDTADEKEEEVAEVVEKVDEAKAKEDVQLPPPPPPATHSWKKPKRPRKKLMISGASKVEIVSPVVLSSPLGFSFAQKRHHYRHIKNRRPSQGLKAVAPKKVPCATATSSKAADKRCFEYGNYNRYYGYRNSDSGDDQRLRYLNQDWFFGKDILDIGCNVGHMTLAVAKNFQPRSILGVDIDESLIKMAKKNVKHYTSCIIPQQTPSHYGTPQPTPEPEQTEMFPMSLPVLYGPVDPTNPSMMPGSVRDSDHSSRASGTNPPSINPLPFPQNVRFAQANYVLESDDLLDAIQPEYDAILCLSTTKWIHLNFGDEGLKRAFKRMFAQLRHGGKLVLEAQGFNSYRKRKNLTERIKENFQNIQLRPEGFHDYLVHEVGFAIGETIAVPHHSAQGFQRPLQVFTKLPPLSSRSASSCHTTPYYASSHNTPYYFAPSPLGMYPPRPGRPPCYAPMAHTPMYSNTWPENETGYDQPDSTAYSPSGGAGSITPSATPTGSGPPSTSNSPFGGHGSP